LNRTKPPFIQGFSLVELSIVLVVIGFLAGSAVVPLTNSIKQSRIRSTSEQLERIRIAMHGFLVSNGRLPCPVSRDDLSSAMSLISNASSFCSIGSGGLPAAALGGVGQVADGSLLDAWNRPYQYVVSLADNAELGEAGKPDWLSRNEPSNIGAENLHADLILCRKSSNSRCPKSDLIADQIVWTVYSLGENASNVGLQKENQDQDNVFSISGYSINKTQPFDDQFIWASRSEIVYWLLRANWLP